jgi:hypothetical protein
MSGAGHVAGRIGVRPAPALRIEQPRGLRAIAVGRARAAEREQAIGSGQVLQAVVRVPRGRASVGQRIAVEGRRRRVGQALPAQRVDVECVDLVAAVVAVPTAPDEQPVAPLVVRGTGPRGHDAGRPVGAVDRGGVRPGRRDARERCVDPQPRAGREVAERRGMRGAGEHRARRDRGARACTDTAARGHCTVTVTVRVVVPAAFVAWMV